MRAHYLSGSLGRQVVCYPRNVCFAGGYGESLHSLLIRNFCASENLVVNVEMVSYPDLGFTLLGSLGLCSRVDTFFTL